MKFTLTDENLQSNNIIENFKLLFPHSLEDTNIDFGMIKGGSIQYTKTIFAPNQNNESVSEFNSIINSILQLKDMTNEIPLIIKKIYYICLIIVCNCNCRHMSRMYELDQTVDCNCCTRHSIQNPPIIEWIDDIEIYRDYLI